MGLFGRKYKKKNKVSFGIDVEGGEHSSHDFHKTTEDDKKIINEAPSQQTQHTITNSSTSVTSSSSSKADEETRQQQQQQQQQKEIQGEIASANEILLPFREPKPLYRNLSMNSDLDESHRQASKHEEADYLERSVDFDEMDQMSSEKTFDFMTPVVTPCPNAHKLQEANNLPANLKPSLGTTVMPPVPNLDQSKSVRMGGRDVAPDINKLSALVIESNDNNSNHGKSNSNHSKSNSNHSKSISSKKSQGKANLAAVDPLPNGNGNNNNNHDTNRSHQNSDQQMQQQHPQQNQHQYYPQQQQQQPPPQQLLPHEIEIEQTRDLVKVFIGEIWNRGEIESIEKVCSPRLRFNGHIGLERVGHDGFSRMVTTVRSSLEGYHCEIHSMVVEGRKCFCRLKFTGKHVGMLMGYPPTHKLVAWMGASEFTICPRKKQILKVWELGDIKTLENQLMR